jgi:hypothetical protein
MRIIISVEFDIEPDEIPDVLKPIEAVGYDLGCEQILVYQLSGVNLEIEGRGIIPHAVFWPVKRGGEDD